MGPTDIVRTLFGLVLLGLTAMGFGAFGWRPPEVASLARPLRDAILSSGYIIPVVLIVYAVSGLAFIANRYVALAAILLFPVSVNILLFHVFLNRASVPLALILFLPNLFMLYACRDAYAPLLRPRP